MILMYIIKIMGYFILQAASSYLGAFLPNGYFATANEIGNEVALWPLPAESKLIITEAAKTFPIENMSDRIQRLVYTFPNNNNSYFSPNFCLTTACGGLETVKNHFFLLQEQVLAK